MKTENSILDFLHFSRPTKDQTDALVTRGVKEIEMF
jgi:hypothetical protein